MIPIVEQHLQWWKDHYANNWREHNQEQRLGEIEKALDGFIGERALDFGCGHGEYLKFLATRYEQVVAYDIVPQAVEGAKKNNKQFDNIDYITKEFLLATHEQTYDMILCNCVLKHVCQPRIEPTIEMLASLLKPDAYWIILDYMQDDGISAIIEQHWSVDKWLGLFNKYSLELTRHTSFLEGTTQKQLEILTLQKT